ncbi:predicted protein [Naegleria gruberi]|uniref:Predicted protein n=1 Tax=Naegleria gruberi TaxID=5762 RepID=D2VWM8_NAEGR|nr:uncharacterized protein NAEGRDRAFT_73437 [Naegleria gruberi]EFC38650.1 predicted protein [Naegleria gruberi]|eukprot:XP_002671394.1 predicted protein [Naegleria gruberi strain NEG-M]
MNVDKLKELCDDGKFYEAQQMFVVLFNKTFKQEKYDKCAQILLSGLNKMHQFKQVALLIDLAKYMLSLFTKLNASTTHTFTIKEDKITAIDLIRHIVESYHQLEDITPKEDIQRMISFLDKVVTWSAEHQVPKISDSHGEPFIHMELGKLHFKLGANEESNKNFLKSNSPDEFAEMISEWIKKGEDGEHDLFITRAVLQLLQLKKLEMAKRVFELLQQKTEKLSSTPLLHFVKFLIISIEKGNLELYHHINQSYATELTRRDASFKDVYLDKIGSIYFGLQKSKPQNQGLGSMINSLFSSMMSK